MTWLRFIFWPDLWHSKRADGYANLGFCWYELLGPKSSSEAMWW